MGLIKECRCGAIIDYALKYCNSCESKAMRDKRETNSYYDKNVRNQENRAIYNSRRWDKLTKECIYRFKGLDIYSYYILGSIEYGSICHHIEEVNINKSRHYDIDNLIYLNPRNHNIIHGLYKNDYEGTKKMLFELVDRWKEEGKVIR